VGAFRLTAVGYPGCGRFQEGTTGPLDSAKKEALRALLKFDVSEFEFEGFEEAC
jgi:hypothetical protein